LENAKKLVAEFKRRINAEIRRQEKLDLAEEKDFRRGDLSGKYTAKMLYKWNDGRFEDEYLRKLKRNWRWWKREDKTKKKDEPTSISRSRNLEGEVMSEMQSLDISFFI